MIKVLIEVEAGSCRKNRYDEQTFAHKGEVKTCLPYPYPYGFILNTRATDGDALDCYVLTREHLKPGTIVACEPLGILEVMEGSEPDPKILAALPGESPVLDDALRHELANFITGIFRSYPHVIVKIGNL